MTFTAVCLGVVVLLAILGTADCRTQAFTGKIAERRLPRKAEYSDVLWWFRAPREECEKRWEELTVTACGVDHTERVPTCDGMCNSETGYDERFDGTLRVVRNCNCCLIEDGSIHWEDKTYPGCPESVSIPRDLTCKCNSCLRDIEIRNFNVTIV